MTHLNGRVFTRLQQYAALPKSIQSETERLEQYLTSIQSDLFDSHRTLSLKSVYGVRARPLLERIEAWVKKTGQQEAGSEDHHVANAPPMHIGNYRTATGGSPATVVMPLVPPVSDQTAGAHIPHAWTLLDALVLKGFVTPHKEDKLDETPSAATEELEIKNTDLLTAVGTRIVVPKNGAPTVWDLVDGAVFAGMLKRKAGLLESITHGKDVYVMVDARLKNITLFASDLGREPLLQLEADSLKVAFADSHYANGVKLWNETGDTELFNAASPHESDALVHALMAVGATQYTQTSEHSESTTDRIRREVKEHLGGDQSSQQQHYHEHNATNTATQDPSYPSESSKSEQDKMRNAASAPALGSTQTFKKGEQMRETDKLKNSEGGLGMQNNLSNRSAP